MVSKRLPFYVCDIFKWSCSPTGIPIRTKSMTNVADHHLRAHVTNLSTLHFHSKNDDTTNKIRHSQIKQCVLSVRTYSKTRRSHRYNRSLRLTLPRATNLRQNSMSRS